MQQQAAGVGQPLFCLSVPQPHTDSSCAQMHRDTPAARVGSVSCSLPIMLFRALWDLVCRDLHERVKHHDSRYRSVSRLEPQEHGVPCIL